MKYFNPNIKAQHSSIQTYSHPQDQTRQEGRQTTAINSEGECVKSLPVFTCLLKKYRQGQLGLSVVVVPLP